MKEKNGPKNIYIYLYSSQLYINLKKQVCAPRYWGILGRSVTYCDGYWDCKQ